MDKFRAYLAQFRLLRAFKHFFDDVLALLLIPYHFVYIVATLAREEEVLRLRDPIRGWNDRPFHS
ncbi:MAG TPA: hypothetical protein VG845_13275 [Dehalococcoidia bacterium]|jgi:hypothetical protein|nr:hypothetical protein [Dehalococcoidia bacterium]